jgi:hypothetical protein
MDAELMRRKKEFREMRGARRAKEKTESAEFFAMIKTMSLEEKIDALTVMVKAHDELFHILEESEDGLEELKDKHEQELEIFKLMEQKMNSNQVGET